MNPDDIQLQNLNKSFEYTKLAREIDTCNDTDELQEHSKVLCQTLLKNTRNSSVYRKYLNYV